VTKLLQLMVATTLVLLCTRPPAMAWARVAPWLLPLPAIVIIGREVLAPKLSSSSSGNRQSFVSN